jgi:hypothetical protein
MGAYADAETLSGTVKPVVTKAQTEAEERRRELRRMLDHAPEWDATKLSFAVGRGKDYFNDFLRSRKSDIASDAWKKAVEILTARPEATEDEISAAFDPKDVHLMSLALRQLSGSETAVPDLLRTFLKEIYTQRLNRSDRPARSPQSPPQVREDD